MRGRSRARSLLSMQELRRTGLDPWPNLNAHQASGRRAGYSSSCRQAVHRAFGRPNTGVRKCCYVSPDGCPAAERGNALSGSVAGDRRNRLTCTVVETTSSAWLPSGRQTPLAGPRAGDSQRRAVSSRRCRLPCSPRLSILVREYPVLHRRRGERRLGSETDRRGSRVPFGFLSTHSFCNQVFVVTNRNGQRVVACPATLWLPGASDGVRRVPLRD